MPSTTRPSSARQSRSQLMVVWVRRALSSWQGFPHTMMASSSQCGNEDQSDCVLAPNIGRQHGDRRRCTTQLAGSSDPGPRLANWDTFGTRPVPLETRANAPHRSYGSTSRGHTQVVSLTRTLADFGEQPARPTLAPFPLLAGPRRSPEAIREEKAIRQSGKEEGPPG
jgi:hypothetical protein